MLLAACGGGTGETGGKFADINDGPSGKPVPPVTLMNLTGLSQAKSRVVAEALALEAGKRDIGIVEGALDSSHFSLTGSFRLIQDGAQATLTAEWVLKDQAGQVLHTLSRDETGLISDAGKPWSAVTDPMLQRIAAYTAKNLADKLATLGYATVAEGRRPPPQSDPVETATLGDAVKKPRKQSLSADVPAIKAVAILPVTGLTGEAPNELGRAMRASMKKAGWPVVSKPRADAIIVRGRIAAGSAKDGMRTVKLTWTVTAPDGRVLGTITQSNAMPEEAVGAAWGDNARYAAEGAASGIFDLIDKLR